MNTLLENVVCRIDRYSSDANTKVYGNRSAFFLDFFLRFKQASIYIGAAMIIQKSMGIGLHFFLDFF